MRLFVTAIWIFGKLNFFMVILTTLPNSLPFTFAETVTCPESCWCDNVGEKLVAVCWDHNLTLVPQYFDKRLHEVALMFNNITTIHDYVFHGLSNVSFLLIQHNEVNEIHEQAFDGLYNLIYLDLSHNKIFKMPSKSIQNNEKLKYLYLNHNKISISGPFLISTSLSVLDISFCKISFLPHDTFIGTPNLIKLKINDNYIAEFEMYAFRGLRKLETLSSGNNLITYLDSILFFGLGELKYVDFSNNSISMLTPKLFENNRKLRYLFLKNNSVIILNSGPILISESLSHLDISFCNITSMASDAFMYLTNLTSLRMVGNPLTNLDTETMKPLKKLQIILMGSESSCTETSFQNIFEYFQQKSVVFYAPPLCSAGSMITNPTIIYTFPSTTVTPSQIPKRNISDIIFHSDPTFNNSSHIKYAHDMQEHIVLLIAISSILRVWR